MGKIAPGIIKNGNSEINKIWKTTAAKDKNKLLSCWNDLKWLYLQDQTIIYISIYGFKR